MATMIRHTSWLFGIVLLWGATVTAASAQPGGTTSAAGSAGGSSSSTDEIEANYPSADDIIDATEPTCNLGELQGRLNYPEPARRRDIEGKVIVRVLVDAAGTPVHSFIDYTDHDLLSEEAQRAVMDTRFTPGEQHGKPVAVWVSVPVVFKLK
jgi:TonB family protein